ncbi:acyl dehydratase [Hoeflea halophila]|uniref:Acyl dehydratase n=1 Tax=Hoeflea halophila TaxID=714899 RepID=A0A286I8X4_9HYPH|nr:MaoC/PaaZ C-terminal domain-containing protein [Hoeflea halophila]SOE16540.1 acyl dehydratase [Hoeflea halophila]
MKIELSNRWTPTQTEFDLFAQISGDDNPIHVDPEFSARTAFGRTVSHGMLIYTRLWGLLIAAHPEISQTGQSMMFPNPCYTGEPVQLTISGECPGTLSVRAVRSSDGAELMVGEAEVA